MAKPLIEIEKELAKQRFEEHLPRKGVKAYKPMWSKILDDISSGAGS